MYGGGSNGAGDARKLEQERQDRINKGLAQINATFAGTRGANAATAYTPGTTYYDEFGQVWTPPPEDLSRARGEARRGTPGYADRQYEAAIKAGKLFTGTETSGGFDDAFYNQRAADVEAFQLPQFHQQYQSARNTLAASLARRGLLKSGAAIEGQTDLDQYAATKRRAVADAGLTAANNLRREVDDSKAQLTSQLIASGDPASASAGALAAAGALRKPSAMPALGNLFSDWVDAWSANQNARQYDSNVAPLFSFGSSRGSSQRIVGGG